MDPQATSLPARAAAAPLPRPRRDREAFLAEASTRLLRDTLDPEGTLTAIAELATEGLCDYANVDLIDEPTGEVRRVSISHRDASKDAMVKEYAERYPPRPRFVEVVRALGQGQVVTYNDISHEFVRQYANRPGEMELVARLGLMHLVIVPLRGRRGLLGALSFTRSSGVAFDEDDITLAKELAYRAGLAYENAALHEETRLLQARWRSLVEHAPDWIYLASKDGRILHINRGRGHLKAGDIEGGSIYRWLSPEEAAHFREAFERVFATGQLGAVTTTARIDGKLEHYECRIAPVITDGRVVAVTVSTTDVTERVDLNHALARTADSLRDFVETSAIGLHWVGPDGTILWANPADHAFLGYAKDEYVGRDIREFHADPHVIADILARLKRDERLHEYPARLRAKDGSIRHVLIDSSVYWEKGEFVHTRCFTRDVTAQRQAEERLRASEERLRLILDTAPAQVLTIDAAGHILTINRSMRGADPEKSLGLNVYDTIVPEDRDRVRAIIEATLRTGRPAEYETRAFAAHGVIRWFHVRVGPLGGADARIGNSAPAAVLISTDVDERKRIEDEIERMRAQLVQGEKLAALGSLVSGVAHELRTPLTYLANNAFLVELRLRAAARDGSTMAAALPSVEPFLAEIKGGVDRINVLVEDLRKYTRARLDTAIVVQPLNALLSEAIELFTATARGSHMLETSLACSANVRANKGSLQQLLLNLLHNAAEASPAGSPISVTTRQADGQAILEVSDQGSGIEESVQKRMYEPLFTTKAEGTGLGLSIVKRIVDDHHAVIECDTAPGKGTTFRVIFPAA